LIEVSYRPAREIDPGWQAFIEGHWLSIEVAVLIRRADGAERVAFGTAERPVPVEVEADDHYTIRREVPNED
jgi:hypothetical protein